MQLSPEEMAGMAYFRRENCASCHALGDRVPPSVPTLRSAHSQIRRVDDPAFQASRIHAAGHVHAGDPVDRCSTQFPGRVPVEAERAKCQALENAPDFAAEGALIYQANHCGACHMVNGVGMKVGPVLNGLSKRQSRSWVIGHFQDPQKLAPAQNNIKLNEYT